MVVKVHGFPVSGATRAVTLTLQELGVPYELVIVNVKDGEHKSAEYLENMHPFGQIPVLVDEDGFTLFESRAIARYLVAKYGPDSGLAPKELKKNALFEQAMSIESSDFAPYAGGLGSEVMKPMRGLEVSQERVSEYTSTLEQKLKVYDKILSKQKYLAGNEITLADLLHLPLGNFITERAGFKGLTATPNVARWWSDISSRESWKNVLAEGQALMAKLS
ncbi:hypothetical protein ACEPAF_2028 [Sanghuangporus sanghuang]